MTTLAVRFYDIVLTVHILAMMGGVLTPAYRRLAQLAERDANAGGTPSADYERERKQTEMFGGLTLLLIVVAIFVMVVKPGA